MIGSQSDSDVTGSSEKQGPASLSKKDHQGGGVGGAVRLSWDTFNPKEGQRSLGGRLYLQVGQHALLQQCGETQAVAPPYRTFSSVRVCV